MSSPLRLTDSGLYCERGDFHIDPWRPVDRAVITHAHADHARRGSRRYLCAPDSKLVLRRRLDRAARIDSLEYGKPLLLNGVHISLHPAGHVLGSAQIRVEDRGQVWVVSGDYKVESDATCRAFEPVSCHTFVSECTFGLPVYRWPRQRDVFAAINDWWLQNRDAGRASLIFAYALGKAQRLLAGINPEIGPIFCHGAVERVNSDYRETGIQLPETRYAGTGKAKQDFAGALVVAPPSAMSTTWVRKFGDYSSAFASGWMLIRGTRRRRAVDRGFVLSDHVDWTGLNDTIDATGAGRVLLTHGQTGPMKRWLLERGLDADALATQFEGEQDEQSDSSDQAGASVEFAADGHEADGHEADVEATNSGEVGG